MGDVLQIDSGYVSTTPGKYKISCLVSSGFDATQTNHLIQFRIEVPN